MIRTSRVVGRIAAGALIIGTVVAGAAPAQAAAGDWKQDGFSPARTYFNPNESTITPSTINAVTQRWRVLLPAQTCGVATAPVVAGGRVFVADEKGIGAYRATTGRLLWHRNSARLLGDAHLAFSGGLLLAVPAVADEHCGPVQDNVLLGLDPATGALRWQARTAVPMRSLVVDRGVAVVSGASASAGAVVTAFRVSDGAQRWRRNGLLSSGVSAAGRLLLSRVSPAGLVAVSVTTGKTLWRVARRGTVLAATPAGDLVYVGEIRPGDVEDLVCLRATNGSVAWRSGDAGFLGELATDGRRVYTLIGNGFTARDALTGAAVWTTDLESDPGQPSLAGGLLYAKSEFTGLAILNVTNGHRAAPGDGFGSFDEQEPDPPTVANGWLFLASASNARVIAYAP
ncbi:PQQ-binding-like beta-propeller repeat protein [Krasilnikovia sp. MM14-A1004]|uniref:outer membrane protein assembly factor BamB family protein n=1 Tax=Krasilnikovia sp. MM14-A1004 TaxID=3373541 RepID=UPI00399C536C